MKNQKIIFILIGVFCVFALVAGIYAQFFVEKQNNVTQDPTINGKDETKVKTQEEIKNQFKNLFTNEFLSNEVFDINSIQKSDASKEIVYSAYDVQKQDEKYEIDIHLPVINIKGDVPKGFNQITQTVFANQASKIVKNEYAEKIIYNVNYIASINNNILSVVIESTFKNGNNPQRAIIQTYNYNLETGEKVDFINVLANKNIVQSECQNKINQVVSKAQEEAEILVKSGYTVYNRDLSSDIYKISNISNFFLSNNGELYIIFAYGNQNYTSELDIILYE